MGAVRGCNIPENLLFHVGHNVWVRLDSGGSVTIGLTAYACALAGQFVACTPRRVGKVVRKGSSCATIESGKWVGPVKTPVAGEVAVVNHAVAVNPSLINDDPYGEGWLVKIIPGNWQADSAALRSGKEVLAAFSAKMESDGFAGC